MTSIFSPQIISTSNLLSMSFGNSTPLTGITDMNKKNPSIVGLSTNSSLLNLTFGGSSPNISGVDGLSQSISTAQSNMLTISSLSESISKAHQNIINSGDTKAIKNMEDTVAGYVTSGDYSGLQNYITTLQNKQKDSTEQSSTT